MEGEIGAKQRNSDLQKDEFLICFPALRQTRLDERSELRDDGEVHSPALHHAHRWRDHNSRSDLLLDIHLQCRPTLQRLISGDHSL